MSDKIILVSGKSVLVLSSADYRQIGIDASNENEEGVKSRDLLGSSRFADSSDPLFAQLEDAGLLEIGSILIQSPYDRSLYISSTEAAYSFAKDQCVNFIEMCSYLGVKRIYTKSVQIRKMDNKWVGTASLDTPYGGLGFDISQEAWGEITKELQLELTTFSGNKPDFGKARQHLQNSLLANDSLAITIVKLAEAGFPPHTLKFHLNASQGCGTNLKSALSLNIPKLLTSVGASLEVTKKESYLFTLEIEAEFWSKQSD